MKKAKIWRQVLSVTSSLVTISGNALGGGGMGLRRLRARPLLTGVPVPLGLPEAGSSWT